jgi:hypothetical protein
MKSKEQLIKEFRELKNDVARWVWLRDNQTEENLPPVTLDNDDTCVYMGEINGEDEFLQFSNYIGWSDGVQELLEAMGIKNECC